VKGNFQVKQKTCKKVPLLQENPTATCESREYLELRHSTTRRGEQDPSRNLGYEGGKKPQTDLKIIWA